MQAGKHLDAVMESTHHLYALFKALGVFGLPPCLQVAVLVILRALVVKSMSHLVADDHADSTIVERIIGCHIEEGRLQDACREAYLIGCGVVVSVHCLGSHKPLLLIHRLVEMLGYLVLETPCLACENVLKVAVTNLQRTVVGPLIGITHLHIEGIQLLTRHFLGLGSHPILHIDALAQSLLQIGHQLLHTLLGCRREVLGHIELSKSFTQEAIDARYSTLPAGTILSLSAQCSTPE